MKTTQKPGGIDSVSRMLLCGLVVMVAGLVGCPGDQRMPCAGGSVMVRGTDDANNEFGNFTFEADQCDYTIRDGTLQIDFLDRTVAGPVIPRVLLTLDLTIESLDDIPLGTPIDLVRQDPTLPKPAIYQDYVDPQRRDFRDFVDDLGPADGRFWTSISGSITFSQDEDGNIVGTFDFDADNPSNPTPSNDASGTLAVEGEVNLGPRS
ncbi:MAG: hypothetical protein O7D91_09535 [Planctomycetota bacterium]|nr:hypothetical protein [Planctomycetota bacterium]